GQKYECRHCNTTMQTNKEYSKHLETHKKYNCTWPKCKKTYFRIYDLQRHYKTHQYKLQCGCGNLFSRRDTLRIHQRRCDGSSLEQKYECRYGNATTKTTKEYSEHLKTHREQDLYKCTCSKCGRKFRYPAELRDHYERNQRQLCENCGRFISGKSNLQRHKQRFHGVRKVKKYECPHVNCSATVQSRTEYLEHFQTHDKPFHYQCKHSGCGKEFRKSCSFFRHKKFCQHKPPNSAEGNSQLGHLADTGNHHIAGQSSVGEQDRSSNDYPLEKFNIIDDLDGSIFDDLNIPDNVVVDVEDINIDDGNIFDGVVVNEWMIE
ncbi:zinc finger protein, partial [Loa loa]